MPFFGIPIRNGLPIGLGSSAGINAWSPGYASLDLTFAGATTLDPRITFSRTSNATLTDSNGRVAYAPHNLLTNSEDFEAAIWQKFSATVTSNTAVAPDGTTTADLLTGTAVSQRLQQTFTAGGAINTYSLYVKAPPSGTFTGCSLLLFNVTTSSVVAQARFSGATFTDPESGLATSAFVSDGWYRIALTNTSGVTAGNSVVAYIYTDNDTGSGTVGSAVLAWGAQLNVANAPVNLLINSVFANTGGVAPTGYTSAFGTGTSAPSGTASNGDVIYTQTATAQRPFFSLSLTTVVGVVYTQSITITAASGVSASQVLGVSGITPTYTLNGVSILTSTPVTPGILTATWTAVGTASDVRFGIGVSGNATGSISFHSAQVNTGSTTLPYVATTSSIYLPPSYNSTTPKNLLGFTQEFDNAAWTKSNSFVQTNLLTWSEQFDNAVWTNNTLVTANTGLAPNGTTTADTLTSNGTQSNLGFSISSVSGAQYTLSVYVKYTNNQWVILQLSDTGVTDRARAWFDIQNGVVGTTAVTGGGVIISRSITAQGNGWYRCTLTATNPVTTLYTYFPILVTADGATTVAANGQICQVWGAQLVQGSVPGDYQVTTSAAAAVQYSDPNGTRTADKLVEDAAASQHLALQSITVAVAPYNFSVYAKAAERSRFTIRYGSISPADNATFDLSTGLVVSGTGTITPVGSGWYRCSVISTPSTAGIRTHQIYLNTATGVGAESYTGPIRLQPASSAHQHGLLRAEV